MSEVTETLSSATDELLTRLQASPTDLRKLVGAVVRRDCQVVGISGAAPRPASSEPELDEGSSAPRGSAKDCRARWRR
jgi:hypothetical protein